MRIDTFIKGYINPEKNKFKDNYDSTIKVLPINTNTVTSGLAKKCGLSGTIGSLYRIQENIDPKLTSEKSTSPIQQFKEKVHAFVDDECYEENSRGEIKKIIDDIAFTDDKLKILDPHFLRYLLNDSEKKYSNGQIKAAYYLNSLCETELINSTNENSNLFNDILKNALLSDAKEEKKIKTDDYCTLPFVKEQFNEYLEWLKSLNYKSYIKYSKCFFSFFLSYSVIQTVLHLNESNKDTLSIPKKLYYLIFGQSASSRKEAVKKGWHTQGAPMINLLFSYVQALDICNAITEGKKGFYPDLVEDINAELNTEDWKVCHAVLETYKTRKSDLISNREGDEVKETTNQFNINDFKTFNDFKDKLIELTTNLQANEFKRYGKKIEDLLRINFLQTRKEYKVLVINEEYLIFLLAMITKGKREKMDNVYLNLEQTFGICFNIGTKAAIEDYLLKLNILERKSDSGDAKYIKIIL